MATKSVRRRLSVQKKQRYLDVEISAGQFNIDAIGFEGEGCEAMTAIFNAIGEETVTRRKPDYFQGGTEGITHKIRT